MLELHVPALRERLDDVPPLVGVMLDRASRHIGVPRPEISGAALDQLPSHPFRGNGREIENVLERAVTLC